MEITLTTPALLFPAISLLRVSGELSIRETTISFQALDVELSNRASPEKRGP